MLETAFFDTLFVTVLATVVGLAGGLLPGIGQVITLLIFYPYVLTLDLFHALLFYLAAVSASQYSGSVVATTMGIPGDASSLPAVSEGHKLFRRGLGHFAISNAAIGSIIGAFIAVATVYMLLPYSVELIKNFYNNNIQLIIIMFVGVFMIAFHGSSIKNNLLLFMLGLFLGSIGVSQVPLMVMWDNVIPYSWYPKLYQGLPIFPVIVALFVIPVLFQSWNTKINNLENFNQISTGKISEHVQEYKKSFMAGIRGSLIGNVCGLVPHLTTVLASNLSYTIEKYIGRKRKTYNSTGDLQSLVAAETANNSAAFVQLTPLLLIGIPITTSEAILLSILEQNLYLVNYTTTIESGMFSQLVFWFILVNVVAFVFVWPLVKYTKFFYKIPMKAMLSIIFVTLIALIFYLGERNSNGTYYILTFLALLPVGYLLRRQDTLILILAFILQDKIFSVIYRAIIINFS
jgi:putative tricarboxylic transport membrane protein